MLSDLPAAQRGLRPYIAGMTGALLRRRPVLQQHWACLACLRAGRHEARPTKVLSEPTFRGTAPVCDRRLKNLSTSVHASHLNELYAAMASWTLTSQRREREVLQP